MKRNLIIAGAAVLLIGYLIWRAQPEQVLKRRCDLLISMADSVAGGTGFFDLNRLEGLLADRVAVEVEQVSTERERFGQVEVITGYQWLGENVQKSSFDIIEFTSIDIQDDKATVKTRVEGMLEMPDIRMMDGEYFVEFQWKKDERDEWRLVALIWK